MAVASFSEDKIKFKYIKCPECANILSVDFIDKICPNPLCNFDFNGLRGLLDKNDYELHKLLKAVDKDEASREYKLLITAIKYNMLEYLKHFLECNWGAHYNTIYRDFIQPYLDDLNVLKEFLKSDSIQDRDNVIISQNGYKMFRELYKYLIRVRNTEIKRFLRQEFSEFFGNSMRGRIDKVV